MILEGEQTGREGNRKREGNRGATWVPAAPMWRWRCRRELPGSRASPAPATQLPSFSGKHLGLPRHHIAEVSPRELRAKRKVPESHSCSNNFSACVFPELPSDPDPSVCEVGWGQGVGCPTGPQQPFCDNLAPSHQLTAPTAPENKDEVCPARESTRNQTQGFLLQSPCLLGIHSFQTDLGATFRKNQEAHGI